MFYHGFRHGLVSANSKEMTAFSSTSASLSLASGKDIKRTEDGRVTNGLQKGHITRHPNEQITNISSRPIPITFREMQGSFVMQVPADGPICYHLHRKSPPSPNQGAPTSQNVTPLSLLIPHSKVFPLFKPHWLNLFELGAGRPRALVLRLDVAS